MGSPPVCLILSVFIAVMSLRSDILFLARLNNLRENFHG